jgi:hypothetical protein
VTTQTGLIIGAAVALICAAVLRSMPPGFILLVMVVSAILSPFAMAFARRADGGRFVVAALYLGLIGGLLLSVSRYTT